jgi:ATP-dependent exoDNAse (exonuclease V) beta subunit
LAFQLRSAYKLKNRLTPVHLFLRLAGQVGLIDRHTPEWQKKQQRITLRMFEKMLYLFSRSKTLQATLDEVLDVLTQYEAHPEQELPVKEELSGEDAVQIMTVFASKGLEFKVVFAAYTERAGVSRAEDSAILFDPQYAGKAGFGLILGKVNGLPNLKREIYQKCWQTPRGKTEAQRVFYVALTRARELLYVIRGSQSFPWTAPDEYPRSSVRLISETDDSAWLDETFWSADTEPLRQKMMLLQESIEKLSVST